MRCARQKIRKSQIPEISKSENLKIRKFQIPKISKSENLKIRNLKFRKSYILESSLYVKNGRIFGSIIVVCTTLSSLYVKIGQILRMWPGSPKTKTIFQYFPICFLRFFNFFYPFFPIFFNFLSIIFYVFLFFLRAKNITFF